MNLDQVLARFGREVLAHEHETQQHKNTIALLDRLKRGEVSLDEVAIVGDGWQLIPQTPTEPLKTLTDNTTGERFEVQ